MTTKNLIAANRNSNIKIAQQQEYLLCVLLKELVRETGPTRLQDPRSSSHISSDSIEMIQLSSHNSTIKLHLTAKCFCLLTSSMLLNAFCIPIHAVAFTNLKSEIVINTNIAKSNYNHYDFSFLKAAKVVSLHG